MDVSSEDEEDEEVVGDKTVGVLTSLGPVSQYLVCVLPKCWKKKLDKEQRCVTCKSRYSNGGAGTGYTVKLGITVNNKLTMFTAFTDVVVQLVKVLTGKDDMPETPSEVEDLIFQHLPATVTFTLSGQSILKKIF